MKRALLRNLSQMARSMLFHTNFNSNPTAFLAVSTRFSFRFYSSAFDSSNTLKLAPNHNQNASAVDADDVSKEELKMRIQKFFDGDESALPSVIEGVLKRKLSGKHEESDDELMKELGGEPVDDVGDSEIDSDFDQSMEFDTDED